MGLYGHRHYHDDLWVDEVMTIHREAGVYTSPYPCPQFMQAAGIWEDYRVLLSNAGLDNFLTDEPAQFAKLTMGVVQDFKCNLFSANPMVQYKIYNHTIDLPFANFCAAIRVPQWGSCEKIKERPELLMNLYKEICGDRSFTSEDGKIRSIHLPCIRYFAHFVSKCILAKKTSSKFSLADLAFLAAAVKQDRSYNFGALIAYRLATNREKGGVCGGLIASQLLAYHGVGPHCNDLALPIERLDVQAMMHHKFISNCGNTEFLPYVLTFPRAGRWKSKKAKRIVNFPASSLFDLFDREKLSLTMGEVDDYLTSIPPPTVEEEAPTQQHTQDYEASSSSTPQASNIGDGSGWSYNYIPWP